MCLKESIEKYEKEIQDLKRVAYDYARFDNENMSRLLYEEARTLSRVVNDLKKLI